MIYCVRFLSFAPLNWNWFRLFDLFVLRMLPTSAFFLLLRFAMIASGYGVFLERIEQAMVF